MSWFESFWYYISLKMYFDEQVKDSCRYFSNRLEEKSSPFISLYCLTCVLARRQKDRCWMEEETCRNRRSERSFPSFGGKSFATYAERPGETAWREVTSAAATRQVSVSTPPPPPRTPPPPHTPVDYPGGGRRPVARLASSPLIDILSY